MGVHDWVQSFPAVGVEGKAGKTEVRWKHKVKLKSILVTDRAKL
jgi:hypothetical protein